MPLWLLQGIARGPADVELSGAAILLITALLGSLGGVVAVLFRQLMATNAAALIDMRRERDSYRAMAEQAITALEADANRLRRQQGHGDLPVIPAVIPEHSSPVSTVAQGTAEVATLRARLVIATEALGLPARTVAEDNPAGPAEGGGR